MENPEQEQEQHQQQQEAAANAQPHEGEQEQGQEQQGALSPGDNNQEPQPSNSPRSEGAGGDEFKKPGEKRVPVKILCQDGTEIAVAFGPSTPLGAMQEAINKAYLKKHMVKLSDPALYEFKVVDSGVVVHGAECLADLLEAHASNAKGEAAKKDIVQLSPVLREDLPVAVLPAKVRLPNWTYITVKLTDASMTMAEVKAVIEEKTANKVDVSLLSMDYYTVKLRDSGISLANEQDTVAEVLRMDVFAHHPMHKLLELSLELKASMLNLVIHEGFLKKKKKMLMGSQDRYFRLTPSKFAWYDKKASERPLNSLPVDSLSINTGMKSFLGGARPKQFEVISKGKSLLLTAANEDVVQEWLSALDTAIQTARAHRAPVGLFRAKHKHKPKLPPRDPKPVQAKEVPASIRDASMSVSASDSQLSSEIAAFALQSLEQIQTVSDQEAGQRHPSLARTISSGMVKQSVIEKSARLSEIDEDSAEGNVVVPESPHERKSSAAPVNPLPVVIDNGSWMCKAGFGGYSDPVCRVPSVCGRVRATFQHQGPVPIFSLSQRSCYVGSEALARRGILTLRPPIQDGQIVHWDDMEHIWNYAFFEALKVVPEEHEVLLSEPATSKRENRERMAQVMFETFNVPALFIATQPVLSMYSTGSLTALVVDSGEGGTRCVPVYEGHMITNAVRHLPIGGYRLSEYMGRLLSECDFNVDHQHGLSSEHRLVCEIKEKLGYAALDPSMEPKNVTKPYTLPDGKVIELGTQRFRCAEALFQPDVVGDASLGLHAMLAEVIEACPVDVRAALLSNVVLSGGSAGFPGLGVRLERELQALSDSPVKVVVPDQPANAVWRGGSVLASSPAFANHWVSAEEYEEVGPDALSRYV